MVVLIPVLECGIAPRHQIHIDPSRAHSISAVLPTSLSPFPSPSLPSDPCARKANLSRAGASMVKDRARDGAKMPHRKAISLPHRREKKPVGKLGVRPRSEAISARQSGPKEISNNNSGPRKSAHASALGGKK